jgi:hypothetical protein
MMGPGLEVQLKIAVEESLAHYATDNAVFMAERLAACNPYERRPYALYAYSLFHTLFHARSSIVFCL